MQLGIDLVYIPEFKQRIEQHSILEKIFTPDELKQNPRAESLAGIFASKEALFKAIGKKIDWLDIWVEKNESGKPEMHSTHKDLDKITISISHSGDYATAIVSIE